MGTCLVTKLKAVVNNSNLKKFDVLYLPLAATSNVERLQIVQKSGTTDYIKAKLVGQGHFTNSSGTENYGKSMEGSSTITNIYITGTANGGILEISEKYSLEVLLLYTADDAFFAPNSELDLSYLSSLEDWKMGNRQRNGSHVDLDALSKTSPKLSNFAQPYGNVTGSVEQVVENLLAGGQKEANSTLTLLVSYTHVTLNNATVSAQLVATFNSATNVTVKAGETTVAIYNNGTWSYS